MAENKFENKVAINQLLQYLPNPKQVIIQILEKKQKEISDIVKSLSETSYEGDSTVEAKRPDSQVIALELNKAYLARLKVALRIVNELKTDD